MRRLASILAVLLAAIAAAVIPLDTASAQLFGYSDEPSPRKSKSKSRKAVAKKPAAASQDAAGAAAKDAAAATETAKPDAAKAEAAKPDEATSQSTTPSSPASTPSKESEEARAAAEKAKDARAAADEAKDAAKKAKDAAAELAKSAEPEKPKEIIVPTAARADADPVVAAAFKKLDDKTFTAKAHKDDIIAAKVFYGERSGPGLWTAADGLNAKSRAVITEFGKAEDWGLDAKAFEVPDLGSVQTTPEILGEAEAKMSLAALKYARHARGGRVDPLSLSRIWDQVAPIKDPGEVLTTVATREDADAYLRDLHPKHEQFKRLREALLKARGPAAPDEPVDPALLVKIPKGTTHKPNADHADIALLRQRLKVPAEAGAKDTLYDAKLVDAVKAYQKEKGLEASGSLNQATRTALNSEGESKKPNPTRDTQRILINMERWRWMPENLGDFYVWDNIPEFAVRVVKNNEQIYKEKIIVGQPTWPTPVFSADMLYVIFNPEWGMPDGIKMKELKPRLQASGGGFFDSLFGGGGGSVIRAYGLRVSYNGRPVDPDSVDWGSANLSQYSFVQPAGAKNPLGVVKFRFPNKHDVYMHDTPERELFARSSRALSHGCIRVNNPLRFAEILIEHDRGPGAGRSSGDVTLEKPIPVHITYFTAMVDENGKVSTYGDFYGHDSRISSALGGKALPYEARPEEAVETSSVADDPDTSGAPSSGKKKGKKAPESVQDIISNVFLN